MAAFCAAVSQGSSLSSWNTMLIISPFLCMLPRSGWYSPAMRYSRVVLPRPERPVMAQKPFSGRARDISSSTALPLKPL